MNEKDLSTLYDLAYKVVRKDLEELNYSEEYVDFFVDEIIDYIVKDDKTRIQRFYERLGDSKNFDKLQGLINK